MSSTHDYASLVDDQGNPLPVLLAETLRALIPRLQRAYPTVTDPAVVSAIVERAGCRVLARERRIGLIPEPELKRYVWVVLRRTAAALLQQSSHRIMRQSVTGLQSEDYFAHQSDQRHTLAQIEAHVLWNQIMKTLRPRQRRVLALTREGYTGQEISTMLRVRRGAIYALTHRIRRELSHQ